MALLILLYNLRTDQERAFLLDAEPSIVSRVTFAPRPIAGADHPFTHVALAPTNGYFSG